MNLLCGGCGRSVYVGDDRAGLVVPCPYCGQAISAPAMDDADEMIDDSPARANDLTDEFLTRVRLALKKKMLVQCGGCNEQLTVRQHLAGKTVQCPACGARIHIPAPADEKSLRPRKKPAGEANEAAVGSADLQLLVEVAGSEGLEPSSARAQTVVLAALARKRRRTLAPLSVLMLVLVLLAVVGGAMVAKRLLGPVRPDESSAPAAKPRPASVPASAPAKGQSQTRSAYGRQ